MKRIVLLFVIAGGGLLATAGEARAQRSGSLQVTANVVDSRESWNGLSSMQDLSAKLILDNQSAATVETSLSQITMAITPVGTEPRELDRPRQARVTIQYLRN